MMGTAMPFTRGGNRAIARAASALLLIVTSGCGSAPGRTQTQRDLVQAGMTPEEVQEVLGEPVDRWLKEDGESAVWLYRYRAGLGPNVFGVIVGIVLISALVVLIVAAASAGGGGGFHFGGLGGLGRGGGSGGSPPASRCRAP